MQNTLTIQGAAYRSLLNQNSTFPQLSAPYQNNFNETIDTFGGNLLPRHQHTISSTSDYSLQVFYDFYERDEEFVKDTRYVVDIDFQHRFSLLDWNDLVWGGRVPLYS
jgi:iron complex outermembrane receptor protein